MKVRNLIIAAAVLAGLTGALYWSDHHQPAATTEASAEASPKILTINQSDISKIDLKNKNTGEIALSKDGSGKWQITAPKPLAADQNAVSGLLSTVSSLSSDRLVEEKASNLSQYGLAEPALEADITEKAKKKQKLLLGDDTPVGNAVFAKLESDPRVFTVAKYTKTSIDKTVNDLRDKRLLTVDSDKISRVELIEKKQDIEFGRNKDEWQIVKPKALRAEGAQVDSLISTLTNARMDLKGSGDDPKTIESIFDSAIPVATVKVTDPSGTQELQVRKSKDDYYAKSSAVDGMYKVDSTLAKALDKDLDAFRNKKLFDFGFEDPNKIEIHDGAKAYFLTKGGDDWWSGDGKKLDAASAQSLVDKVRDLSAKRFVDSGLATPVMNLIVTSKDGKRVEKVLISKNGDNYIAQREGEPSLYQLDSKSIEELRTQAGDLKPAAQKLAR